MARQGFSLLELSVVLTIISIVIAGGLTLGSAKTEQTKISNSYDELQEIAKAMSMFVNDKGCLPYPANPASAPGNIGFGREPIGNADCATTGGTGLLLQGAVPFYSLGLPDEYGADDWNTRYTYAVIDTAVESSFSSSYTGGITVQDDGSNDITTEATYVLFSHGKTRKGGYTIKTGVVGTACPSGGSVEKDSENCDSDTTFVDGTFNDGSTTANLFDDIVVWKTTTGIYEYTGGGGGGGGGGGSSYPVPSDVRVTTATNDGDFGGYTALQAWIEANGCSGYKVCTAPDIVRYHLENGAPAVTGSAFVAAGFTARVYSGTPSVNDCDGWTSNAGTTSVGAARWDFDDNTIDIGMPTICSMARTVACCRWD